MESGTAVIIARWLFFVAAMVAFGAALFPVYAPPKIGNDDRTANIQPPVFIAAVLALISSLAWLALVILDLDGEDLASFVGTARTFLFETDFGPVWLVRLMAAGALIISAAIRPSPALLVSLAAIVLASEAWIGHSALAASFKN